MRGFLRISGLLVVVLLWLPVPAMAEIGFSYQGKLEKDGAPFTGTQTLSFRLYDSMEDGIEVASMVQIANVDVVDGLFNVNLDFGPGVFDGQPRYVEVEVDGQVLQPRQAVSPSPLALFALTGNEGPPGPQGETGEQGPQGDPGEPGDSHWGLTVGATYYLDGNVGIGVPDPQYRLDIQGSGARISSSIGGGPRFQLKGHALGSPSFLLGSVDFVDINDEYAGGISYRRSIIGDRLWLSAGGSEAVGIDQDGRVGIGIVVPNVQLHVAGGTNAQLNGGGFIAIGDLGSSNIVLDNNEILARNNGDIAPLHFNKFGGEVHIGYFSGGVGRLVTPIVQITGGSDLSENFDIGEIDDLAPQPGMVVSIDPQNPGRLIPTTRAYDRTVAGVISGANGINSGMIMGQQDSEADGAHPVALTGRVYVMTDASRKAVEPGDLLTTSETAGHAMSVDDFTRMHGAVIGKAMTSLEYGEHGMVLVLVNLQ